jgi:division protein CdvB (Snf7/Vps24/ESCRT-III family)
MTDQASKADGVHRLIDMVVEEVSLVDRAANKHRFLIVKRDNAMDDDKTDNTTPTAPSPAAKFDDGTALGAALTALESLTGLVELLGSLGADTADEKLAELAQELRTVAEQLLVRTAYEDDATDVEARAKATPETTAKPVEPATFAANVTAAKQALARLGELAKKVPAAKTEPKPEPAPAAKADAPNVAESLAKLADSFRTLSDTVKEQQQRLGRVEKQFGLPNSAAPAERVSKATVEDVGWPLDLNKPKDRESVDKAISFHDL